MAGLSHFWTFDSHLLSQEPNVIYSQVLSATHTMRVGPMVTKPITRDPTVTASTFATLNTMFGNRTVVAIGRGRNAKLGISERDTVLRLRSQGKTLSEIGALYGVTGSSVGHALKNWRRAAGNNIGGIAA